MQPRKCSCKALNPCGIIVASMRPGLCSPGNAAYTGPLDTGGDGFNEAGAVQPRKSVRISNRGTLPEIASMRPGLCSPGNNFV